jgi:hemoglobin
LNPDATPFDRLGGEPGVRTLVDRFYDLMDLEPAYAGIRTLHPADLQGSRDKLFWFLCGWLGGPDLYIQRFGHPRLRARHLPYYFVPIKCLRQAICVSKLFHWKRTG